MYRDDLTPKQRRAVQIWVDLAPKGSGLVKDVKEAAKDADVSWRTMNEVRPRILVNHGKRSGWNGENHEYELRPPYELAQLHYTQVEIVRGCTCRGWPYPDEDQEWRCISCAKKTERRP